MIKLYQGDCLKVLKRIPAGSVDAVISDPPYPEIDREYGRWTEAEWHELMHGVVHEVRRILKPTGSAMFVLQPNSRKVGSMRPWLWEFLVWCSREWNVVQDAWWWNHTALPLTKNDPNLLRSSIKACVWLGDLGCYRHGHAVLWSESAANLAMRETGRCTNRNQVRASLTNMRDLRARTACIERGGVTAFNLLPIGCDGKDGLIKHPGRTPFQLCDWWVRYISPPDGVVCDPFMGSGTVGLAALKRGRDFIGIERKPEYHAIAKRRISAARAALRKERVSA